jgi:hypothetical protein
MNLYSYVGNNPVDYYDEFGLQRGSGGGRSGRGCPITAARLHQWRTSRALSRHDPIAARQRALNEWPRRNTSKYTQIQNLLKEMAMAKGMQGNQRRFTPGEATFMGIQWIGPGGRPTSDGRGVISLDGTRVWRPPVAKPNCPYAKTGVQSNFSRRDPSTGTEISNYHINVITE